MNAARKSSGCSVSVPSTGGVGVAPSPDPVSATKMAPTRQKATRAPTRSSHLRFLFGFSTGGEVSVSGAPLAGLTSVSPVAGRSTPQWWQNLWLGTVSAPQDGHTGCMGPPSLTTRFLVSGQGAGAGCTPRHVEADPSRTRVPRRSTSTRPALWRRRVSIPAPIIAQECRPSKRGGEGFVYRYRCHLYRRRPPWAKAAGLRSGAG